jgi:hypothetical protein
LFCQNIAESCQNIAQWQLWTIDQTHTHCHFWLFCTARSSTGTTSRQVRAIRARTVVDANMYLTLMLFIVVLRTSALWLLELATVLDN